MPATPVKILTNRRGHQGCGSFSFPLRPNIFHEVELPGIRLHLSPGWRPLFIQGTGQAWPHPLEWIRVSLTGMRIYYSSLGYGDLSSLFEQYYIPVPENRPNTLVFYQPFGHRQVRRVIEVLDNLGDVLERYTTSSSKDVRATLEEIRQATSMWNNFYHLELPRILKGTVTILPPDSMLCDYHVFPLILTTGCLYNCGFCTVKDGTGLNIRTIDELKIQGIELMRRLSQETDLFKGIFLGNLDALAAPDQAILNAVTLGLDLLPETKNLFLFGSVDSLLKKSDSFFMELNRFRLNTYINIGIESLDKATLEVLKKPLEPHRVNLAWDRIIELNKTCDGIEFSLNILLGPALPATHLSTLLSRLKSDGPFPKGAIYLSPLDSPIDRNFFDEAKMIQRSTSRPVRLYNLVGL